jgi:hypothetical protein
VLGLRDGRGCSLCSFFEIRGSFELLLLNPHKNVMVLYGICTDFPHGKPDGRLRLVMERCVKSVFDLLVEQRIEVRLAGLDVDTTGGFSSGRSDAPGYLCV